MTASSRPLEGRPAWAEGSGRRSRDVRLWFKTNLVDVEIVVTEGQDRSAAGVARRRSNSTYESMADEPPITPLDSTETESASVHLLARPHLLCVDSWSNPRPAPASFSMGPRWGHGRTRARGGVDVLEERCGRVAVRAQVDDGRDCD